jgi:4-diphosphocytidyl-2-C-methyl-D-erythritol kinase
MTAHEIKTPAKLNIRLKVVGRRPDGYHDLVSIMVPIALFDHLELTVLKERRTELTCEGFQVPADESNLVCRAVRSFFSSTGLQEGIAIKLIKNIPVAAGMGGGSSDAAATLVALNDLWSRPLSPAELHHIATRLGADVPFFLYCRPSLATGIGEILEPLEKWPRTWYVVVTPRLEISTAWAFGQLKLELTPGEYDFIIDTLKNESMEISQILENDLEKVTSARYPIIDTIKESLMQAGAGGAMMTGSGPSVFGIFSSRQRAASAKEALSSRDLGHVFMATDWTRP